jgi:hypothetical protein
MGHLHSALAILKMSNGDELWGQAPRLESESESTWAEICSLSLSGTNFHFQSAAAFVSHYCRACNALVISAAGPDPSLNGIVRNILGNSCLGRKAVIFPPAAMP